MLLRLLSRARIVQLLAIIALFSAISPACGDEPDAMQKALERFTHRVVAITQIVLEKHVDPPTRQEMFLAGAKRAWASRNRTFPSDASLRISNMKSPEEIADLLQPIWPNSPKSQDIVNEIQAAFLEGLFSVVPDNAHLLPAKEARVQSQIQGNRYVGIGITVGFDKEHHLHTIAGVLSGGSAEKAGLKPGDLIEQIDQTHMTKESSMQQLLDLTRGEEGSQFTMHVRQPKERNSRTVSLLRMPVMIPTVHAGEIESEPHEIPPDIAYFSIGQITASTAHELRILEPKLRSQGKRALIFDFRSMSGERLNTHHAAMLLADSLIDGGGIGQLQTRDGREHFEADRDCLFRDWPLAVLIDGETEGSAEWVAAALQDNDRAIIVGEPSKAENYEMSAIPLAEGDDAVIIATGLTQRPNTGRIERDKEREQGEGSSRNAKNRTAHSWHVTPDYDIKEKTPHFEARNLLDIVKSAVSSDSRDPVAIAVERLTSKLKDTPAPVKAEKP